METSKKYARNNWYSKHRETNKGNNQSNWYEKQNVRRREWVSWMENIQSGKEKKRGKSKRKK